MKNSHTNSKKSINQRTAAMTEIEKAEYSFFKDREDQWKKAFQSAYKRVKTGELSYLCYENSLFLMALLTHWLLLYPVQWVPWVPWVP